MPTILELKEELAANLDEQQTILADADENNGGELSEEHEAQLTALTEREAELNATIDRREKHAARLEETKAKQAKLAESAGRKTSGVSGPRATKANIDDDPKRGYANIGQFASDVFTLSNPSASGKEQAAKNLAAATGNQQSVGTDGGFLVPPTFSSEIWDGMNQMPDSLLAMTDSYTVEGESLTFPANAETSRATGSRYGGVQGYWIAEADQITSSKPTFRQVKIEPQQLAVLIYATDKLLRNTAAMSAYLARAATEEIDFLVGDSIINGEGAGKPKGILAGTAGTSSCRVAVSKETGQAASTIVKENIDKMWSRMHPMSRSRAVWLINIDVEPQLQQLVQDVGTGGVPVYLPPGGISAAPYATLKGRPVMPIEYCATLGTEGDIILADMQGYVTGTQGGVDQAMSMHLRFDYAETAFRFMFAVDGQTWLQKPITPFKGSNTLSPFVTLATRS